MAPYNNLSDSLFKKCKIFKYNDLYKLAVGNFRFNLSLGNHPSKIRDMFRESNNFNRNLDDQLDKPRYSYLKENSPYSLISTWNNIHRSHRDWLKKSYKKGSKLINAPPKKIPISNNIELNKFRLNSFKKIFS